MRAMTSASISASPWIKEPRCWYRATVTTEGFPSGRWKEPCSSTTSWRWCCVAPKPLYTVISSVLPFAKLTVMWASPNRCRTIPTARVILVLKVSLSSASRTKATSSCHATGGKASCEGDSLGQCNAVVIPWEPRSSEILRSTSIMAMLKRRSARGNPGLVPVMVIAHWSSCWSTSQPWRTKFCNKVMIRGGTSDKAGGGAPSVAPWHRCRHSSPRSRASISHWYSSGCR